MTAVTAVRTRLLDIADLAALVGARIYGLVVEQGSGVPYVRVEQISELEGQHLRGPHALKEARVQVDCVARTRSGAEAVEAVMHGDGLGCKASGLFGWRGEVGTPPYRIDLVEAAGRIERFDPPELDQYVISRDYRLRWRVVVV